MEERGDERAGFVRRFRDDLAARRVGDDSTDDRTFEADWLWAVRVPNLVSCPNVGNTTCPGRWERCETTGDKFRRRCSSCERTAVLVNDANSAREVVTRGDVAALPDAMGGDNVVGLAAFACNACERPVTRPLVPLGENFEPEMGDGLPLVPRGSFHTTAEPFWMRSTGRILVQDDDVVNAREAADIGRLNGCCGLDGCDGPNVLCTCGIEIGTRISDCWTPSGVILEQDVVTRVVPLQTRAAHTNQPAGPGGVDAS